MEHRPTEQRLYRIYLKRYGHGWGPKKMVKELLYDGLFSRDEAMRKVKMMAGWYSGNITVEEANIGRVCDD